MLRYWLAPIVLLAVSGALAAALTVTDDHADAAAQARSHSFAQHAKAICVDAAGKTQSVSWPQAAGVVDDAAAALQALPEPPNIHRAVARLVLHWQRGAELLRSGKARSKAYATERHEAFLSAHLLNVKACMVVLPKS
jgi:hypothetical protein